MRKPMKFKRYEGGGEISGTVDPKEAADKEAGLKASKDDDVGFLQRLRMGNIDDPSSEAYKRFGAGRGRSEAPAVAPAEAERPRPVPRPPAYPNPIFAAGEEQGKRQPSGDAGVAEDYSGPRTKPIVTTSGSKPSASKPVAEKPKAKKEVGESVSVNEPKTSEKRVPRFTPNEPPVATHKGKRDEENQSKAPTDVTKLSLAERQKLKNERFKSTDVTKLSLSERSKLGMKSGGSVSSASRRADGIATKGKTRGRMC